MIPEHQQVAVKRALLRTFNVETFDDIQQLTKGLSGALVFKITVQGNPYLLRVVTRTDAFGDPTFYYGCMEVAAEKEVAPRIHYLSIEDRISITDFIREKPFSIATAQTTLPHLLRNMHALPKFPFRLNYFETMERFLPQFAAANLLPIHETKALFEFYERIVSVYPRHDQENWVASHNDSKPDNIIFDGQRPWFVDWESAFLNDRYFDLAIVGNFVTTNEAEEISFLEAYFEKAINDYQYARFFLMQEVLHLYYFIFLMVFDQGEKPIEVSKIKQHDFRKFHNEMWNGEISLADTDAKREYALLHLEQFRVKAGSGRFEDALRVVSRRQKSS